jgi:hypothetical protein
LERNQPRHHLNLHLIYMLLIQIQILRRNNERTPIHHLHLSHTQLLPRPPPRTIIRLLVTITIILRLVTLLPLQYLLQMKDISLPITLHSQLPPLHIANILAITTTAAVPTPPPVVITTTPLPLLYLLITTRLRLPRQAMHKPTIAAAVVAIVIIIEMAEIEIVIEARSRGTIGTAVATIAPLSRPLEATTAVADDEVARYSPRSSGRGLSSVFCFPLVLRCLTY